MAYTVDQSSGDIVINGFQNGIGASPYTGLTDVKNINISSVPGEASVAPSTSSVMSANATANQYTNVTATPNGSNAITFPITAGKFIENGQAILVGTSSITGMTAATLFWVLSAQDQGGNVELIQLSKTYGGVSVQPLGGTGTATFSTVNMTLGPRGPLNKNYIQESSALIASGGTHVLAHWLADSLGQVWTDLITTTGGSNFASTSSWTYTGNTTDSTSHGNGFVYYTSQGTSGIDGWLFLFRDGQIDYLKIIADSQPIAASSLSWVYGWNPLSGATGQTNYLTTGTLYANAILPHEAITTPGGFGGFVNYCDAYNIGQFSQFARGTPFNPTNTATYNFSKFGILPIYDFAQCLAYLGSQLLIGGREHFVYPWDLFSPNPSTPLIQLPEKNSTSIVTVKQNAYIFAGNRGRIYVTNGSQADLWAKVPDHISGTVQPYLAWGAATFGLDKIFFSVYQGTPAAGAAFPTSGNLYGGVWSVDVDTKAMYLSNVLSSGLYSGYVPAIYTFSAKDTMAGYGFYAGWYDSATSSGIDVSVDAPYTGSQAVVISDMIPIGTTIQPTTPSQFEFKLSAPLLSTESVQLLTGSNLTGSFTSQGTVSGSSTATIISGIFPSTIQEQQWLLVKAILTSRTSSPSYARLTEIRIKGATVNKPTMSGFETQ